MHYMYDSTIAQIEFSFFLYNQSELTVIEVMKTTKRDNCGVQG